MKKEIRIALLGLVAALIVCAGWGEYQQATAEYWRKQYDREKAKATLLEMLASDTTTEGGAKCYTAKVCVSQAGNAGASTITLPGSR